MTARIAILDYGVGNLRSVEKALEHVGATGTITAGHEEVRACDGIVLPGVGAFPKAMERVRALGLDQLVRERCDAGSGREGGRITEERRLREDAVGPIRDHSNGLPLGPREPAGVVPDAIRNAEPADPAPRSTRASRARARSRTRARTNPRASASASGGRCRRSRVHSRSR